MEDIWKDKTVYIKGFWGWSPEKWAAIGFNNNYRDTLINNTTDPFIMVAYVTQNSQSADAEIKGKIVGFFIVSHEKGHRNDFTDPIHHQRDPEKWQNALRAIKAYSFPLEYQPDVYNFDPTLKAQGKARYGARLTEDQIEKLKSLPYFETPVYNSTFGYAPEVDDSIFVPSSGKVRGGTVNRSGYFVNGEPIDTEKELYALILKGGSEPFLNDTASDHAIYKIGLSISPKTRLTTFQKALPQTLPKDKIIWELHRSTRQDGHPAYPNYDSALQGEEAMKDYLSSVGKWLGGEFYAATKEQFEQAWTLGREAALKFKAKEEE